jgi:hypothetical protein
MAVGRHGARCPRATQCGDADCSAPGQPDLCAPGEHVVVRLLDRVEDLAVQRERRAQAIARRPIDQVDARRGGSVQRTCTLDLVREQVADRPVRDTAGQPRAVDAELLE